MLTPVALTVTITNDGSIVVCAASTLITRVLGSPADIICPRCPSRKAWSTPTVGVAQRDTRSASWFEANAAGNGMPGAGAVVEGCKVVMGVVDGTTIDNNEGDPANSDCGAHRRGTDREGSRSDVK